MRFLAIALLALGVGAACAKPPVELERAQNSYTAAAQDPSLEAHASVELYEAQKTLERLERAWTVRRDAAEVQHLAYVLERQLQAAAATAERRRDEDRLAELAEERDKMLLQVRTEEADAMRARAEARAREAERLALEAEQRAREAELARAEAEAARERVAQLQASLEELGARQTQRGMVLTLGDVLFDLDRAELKPGALRNLYRLVTFLREHPEHGIIVEGHTDSTGDAGYNLDLSDRRAAAVRAFLDENGIDPNRLVSRGYGESYPVVSNNSASGRQQNRRVEVVILNPGESPESHLRELPSVAAPPESVD